MDCSQCDLAAVRLFTPPLLVKVAADVCYDSPVTGEPITSHAARVEDLKRHDCIPYDPEMKTDYHRRREESQAALERAVDDTVAQEVAKLSSGQREKLVNEVVHGGATVDVRRD